MDVLAVVRATEQKKGISLNTVEVTKALAKGKIHTGGLNGA